jgi:hypothetical protein
VAQTKIGELLERWKARAREAWSTDNGPVAIRRCVAELEAAIAAGTLDVPGLRPLEGVGTIAIAVPVTNAPAVLAILRDALTIQGIEVEEHAGPGGHELAPAVQPDGRYEGAPARVVLVSKLRDRGPYQYPMVRAAARRVLGGAVPCCERDYDSDGNCDRHPAGRAPASVVSLQCPVCLAPNLEPAEQGEGWARYPSHDDRRRSVPPNTRCEWSGQVFSFPPSPDEGLDL